MTSRRSSGSSLSAIGTDPIRSQNITVIWRRSALPPEVDAERRAPQFPQKLKPAGFDVPQTGQVMVEPLMKTRSLGLGSGGSVGRARPPRTERYGGARRAAWGSAKGRYGGCRYRVKGAVVLAHSLGRRLEHRRGGEIV